MPPFNIYIDFSPKNTPSSKGVPKEYVSEVPSGKSKMCRSSVEPSKGCFVLASIVGADLGQGRYKECLRYQIFVSTIWGGGFQM